MAGTKIETIDISSGEEEDEGEDISRKVEETKIPIDEDNLEILTKPGPAEILESRRKLINDLLGDFQTTYQKLTTQVQFMNPSQLLLFKKLLSKEFKGPNAFEASQSVNQSSDESLELSPRRPTTSTSWRAPARKRYRRVRKTKRSPRKKYTARRTTNSSSVYTARNITTSNYISKAKVKTESKPAQRALFARVKMEK